MSIKYTTKLKCNTHEKDSNNDIKTKSVSGMVQMLESNSKKICYELLPNKGEIRPYFDIDIPYPTIEQWDEREMILDEKLNDIIAIMNLPKGFDDFAISDASLQGIKVSYHVVLPGYKTNMETMYQLREKFKTYMDKKPYHNILTSEHPQKFRTIYSMSADGEQRQLLPINYKDDTSAHFISIISDSAKLFSKKKQASTKNLEGLQSVVSCELKHEGLGCDLKPRTDTYEEWFVVGVSIHALYGREQGYIEFLNYSIRSPKHQHSIFLSTWNGICDRGYTSGGWNYLKKYHLDKTLWEKYTFQTIPPSDDCLKIARWVVNTYKNYTFVQSCGDCYKFENHKWIRYSKINLENDIQSYIHDSYEKECNKYANTESGLIWKALYKKVTGYSGINNLSKMVLNLVNDDHFREKLDQTPYLLGFNNGVLDLRTKQFRNGESSDYISMTTGYDYCDTYDQDDMEAVQQIFKQIACDDEIRYNGMLDIFSRSMVGDNSKTSQKFHCLFGEGANGKSVVGNLISQTFGEYHKIVSTSFLTQQAARSDGANPDLAQMVGARFVFMSEMEETGKINTQTFKTHTGEEAISYRNLFSKHIAKTAITWTLFLLSNEMLRLPCDDYSVLRRMSYIPFKATFVDDITHAEFENCYPKDTCLHLKLPQYRLAFLHLLLSRLDHESNVKLPDCFVNYTKTLLEDADPLKDMLNLSFSPATTQNGTIDCNVGLSWSAIKTTLKNQHGFRYTQAVNGLSESGKKQKIGARLPYTGGIRGSGKGDKLLPYQWRCGFFGIKLAGDDNEDGTCLI